MVWLEIAYFEYLRAKLGVIGLCSAAEAAALRRRPVYTPRRQMALRQRQP